MSNKKNRGLLFIVSAPSGAGKTTLCDRVLKRLKMQKNKIRTSYHFDDSPAFRRGRVKNIVPSVSFTTRARRSGEVSGRDYHFVTELTFKTMIHEKRFAEWAIVHGSYYGTDRQFIDGTTAAGTDVILNIDIQGAEQLIQQYPEAVTIFIHPPSFTELKRRLVERGSDPAHSIQKRLKEAEVELKAASSYRFQIVNDEIERATDELIEVIESQRNRT